jgi:hypothetical protein
MLKTRREALDEFLGFVGEDGDTTARNVAERALVRAVEAIWQKHPWRDFQSPAPLELTLVVNQRSYAMPEFFGRLGQGQVRNLTRGTILTPLDTEDAQALFPSAGTSLEVAGTPCRYELGGIVGVRRQPDVDGEALEVVSSSDTDTTVLVSIEGADANGNERRHQVTLTGTTPISVGTWSWVDSIGKSYPTGTDPTTEFTSSVGSVTLNITSSDTVLQTLFPEESAREHRMITVYPKPSETDTIAVPVMRRPKRLLYDADPLPNDWWNAIFEEMLIQWRVNTGDLAVDSVVPRPHLVDLVCNDNANRPRRTVRPFGVLTR